MYPFGNHTPPLQKLSSVSRIKNINQVSYLPVLVVVAGFLELEFVRSQCVRKRGQCTMRQLIECRRQGQECGWLVRCLRTNQFPRPCIASATSTSSSSFADASRIKALSRGATDRHCSLCTYSTSVPVDAASVTE